MSEVRRATLKSKSWREALRHVSSEKITDVKIESELAEPRLAENEYPFTGQEIIKGAFTYLLYPPRGEPTPISMDFSFRTESKLFILDPGRRDNLGEQVLFELRKLLADDIAIQPGCGISMTGIWNFIESSYEIREIKVKIRSDNTDMGNGQVLQKGKIAVSYDNIPPENVIGKQRVKRAELVFNYEGIFDIIYSQNILSISGTKEQFEYALQIFEKEAIYNG
ncbi:hypothetical protein [Natronococcus occultus]|uniref:Uncharacterized protein n=1 Tax=Natronococcus occultus SP4 TaxID=694430 RepID=L0JYB1_9EURY|nr:hypothetical protein [Natronococcus occultus]AGB37109.1 hypothetical protein Natoc_1286 [Natronococcus occultus SP4]